MAVLERDGQLRVLEECLVAARRGVGRLVWVQGEAGAGKSTLVERFCSGVRGARVVVGSCDPLDTPRPMGPVIDIAERLGAPGVGTTAGAEPPREALFRGFIDELGSRSWVTVAVLEDAHWADQATLDLIRFVGRRLNELRGFVIVTFRDDEVHPGHPLRTVIGDLATASGVVRLELEGLSRNAVAQLAEDAAGPGTVDVAALHTLTNGNPFFVTEVLAAGEAEVPPTVRDAVLARATRLSAPARAVLDTAAVTPTRAEVWLVSALSGADDAALDECVDAGMLRPATPGTVAFRHELARRALEEAMPPAARASLHAGTAALLLEHEAARADAARIAYHADQAGDAALACEYATRAARRATELGAHREAMAQYERALRNDGHLAAHDVATLLEDYAVEAGATDRVDAGLEAATRAVELRRRQGDPRLLGRALVRRSTALWAKGRSAEAAAVNLEAVRVLENLAPGKELAEAYSGAASYAMLARDHPAALRWGRRALELAEHLGAARTLARTLNTLGASKLVNGDRQGVADLQRSIAVAAEAGLEDAVTHAWLNLGSGAGEVRSYEHAEPALREAIRLAAARDHDAHLHYSTAWLARVRLERGDWASAVRLVEGLPLNDPGISPITTVVALAVLGRVRARRGDSPPAAVLDRAWAIATEMGDLQRLWPVAAARAEAAWLAGEPATIPGLVAETFALACERAHAWAIGELGLWLHRGGGGEALPDAAAEPWALHVEGRLTTAARTWEALGCPYEAADALADSDRSTDLLAALATFDELGAAAAGARVRRRLRDRGARRVPRGPRPATVANPAGLTPRQAQVVGLLTLGLSDAEIAGRLHLSTKTVGHHVSAILAKLGVTSRGEAAHHARSFGLTPEDGEPAAPT